MPTDNDNLHINLPFTPFPMEAKLRERLQPQVLQKWRAMHIYRTIMEDRRDAESFILHDGPPYASGDTHIGIGFNKILKDIIVKYWTMRGKRVPFVPGWDCHGLPIETQVRNRLEEEKRIASPNEIRELCASHAVQYIQEQKEQFQRLGVFADWNRPYQTMDFSYEAGVLEVLSEIVKKGYVYRGLRPVYWCPVCKTVLADAEVEPIDVDDRGTAGVHFFVEKGLAEKLGFQDTRLSLLASLREIWTLASCVAIAVNPDRKYVALEVDSDPKSRQIILVEERAEEQVCSRLRIQRSVELPVITGREMQDLIVKHPFNERDIAVVMSDVDRRNETGIAAVSPAHNFDDFKLSQSYDLQILALINEGGYFTNEAGEWLAGQYIREAETSMLNVMRGLETLVYFERETRKEPQGSRCGHMLIIRATQQWFINLEHRDAENERTLRERALDEVDNLIRWVPEDEQSRTDPGEYATRPLSSRPEDYKTQSLNKTRLLNMIRIRNDWCISRQREWGVPIPSLYCKNCAAVILDAEVIKNARDLIALEGSGAWYTKDIKDVLPEGFVCPTCRKGDFDRDQDRSILDVWFESSTSWYSALIGDYRLSFPANLCVEGIDQHRGWFQLSLLTSMMVRGRAPFSALLTHGFVLDEKKKKMTKALKNFVTLGIALDGVAGAPADLIRLYFIWNKNITNNLPLSIRDILDLQPIYRRFRGSFRFLLGNLNNYYPSEDAVPLSELSRLDQWILSRLYRLIEQVTQAYERYNFQEAVQKIYTFCDDDLSRVYFEVVKDRLYSEAAKSYERRSVQTAMHSILVGLVKMLAPVLVYTCEEVWEFCPGISDCASVHLSLWPDKKGGLVNRDGGLESEYEWMLDLRSALLPKFQQAEGIATPLQATLTLTSVSSDFSEEFLRARQKELREFLIVSELKIVHSTIGLESVPDLEGIYYRIDKCPHPQCFRCRQYDATVGSNTDLPTICERCTSAIKEAESHKINMPEISISPDLRPSELAVYLRKRGIRKIAFLNEGTKLTAYYYNLPSQQVQPHAGLRPLADYLYQHHDFRDHAAILLGLGEHTDVLFGIAIHQLDRGSPLGGTREFTYASIGDLLENLLRLSYGMSIKNSIGDLPHGGGKSIIDTCGLDLKVHRELRRRIYRDFGQFTATLFGRYICAEDIGNTTKDTRDMLSFCRHVMCLPEAVGGSGNPSRFTALVGWLAARAGWKFLTGRNSLDGLTIAIQGAGQVGQHLIDILTEGNPGKLLIADKEAVQIENVRKLLHRKGKLSLLDQREWRDPLEPWKDKLEVDRQGSTLIMDQINKYILYSQCDILVPVAVGKVIYPANVPFLRCKLIVPIANNAYSDNDVVARKVWGREITDVVENNVNWGGATVAASELYGYDEDHVIRWCLEKAYSETKTLLQGAKDQGVPPWEILKKRAEGQIKQPHPIVEAARGYYFIGRINENFAEWIKKKWLPNISGVGPDKYAEYVVEWANNELAKSECE